jgi:hypothetical protein
MSETTMISSTPSADRETNASQPGQPKDSVQPSKLESPTLPLVSRSTTPGDDSNTESTSGDENSPLPWSLEAQRRQKSESYDPSGLDAFLQKQSLTDDDQCSPGELMDSQLWGHIDPQIAWPPTRSPEWLAEKRKEIDARGGRKANFGKLLTPQVIKERKERGWGIHQTKDVVDDEKSAAAARSLEELFGIKDIDNFEPGLRGGQLAMIEKGIDAEGKKKSTFYLVG